MASCWFFFFFVFVEGILTRQLDFEFNTGPVLLFVTLLFVRKQEREEDFSQRFYFVNAAFRLTILLGWAPGFVIFTLSLQH